MTRGDCGNRVKKRNRIFAVALKKIGSLRETRLFLFLLLSFLLSRIQFAFDEQESSITVIFFNEEF